MRMAIVAGVLASALVCLSAVASAQTGGSRDPFLAVVGQGEVKVPPEFAEFTAEVVTRADSLEAATRQHNDRAAKARAALHGVEKNGVTVERSSFRLEQTRPPVQVPAGQRPPPPDYRAITTFSLKCKPLDGLNDAVSAIAASGLFEVRSVRYGIEDEERALDEARRAAVRNARRQAEIYADAANVQLNEIMEISDGSATPFRAEVALRAAPPNVQIEPPAMIPFHAAISMKWRILPRP